MTSLSRTALSALALALPLALLAGSAAATTLGGGQILSKGKTAGAYSKPGAAVDFAHTVKADGDNGVVVTLEVLELAGSGTVEVELHAPAAVRIGGPTATRFDAAQGNRHTVVFRAESDVPGLHHVGVTARMDGQVRAYAVPVQIGFGGLVRKSGPAPTVRGGVVVMDATETVDGVVIQRPDGQTDLPD